MKGLRKKGESIRSFFILILCLFLSAVLSSVSISAEKRNDPQRIISLAPSVTEILFALGLGERVVGVTDFCNYPEEVKTKARVGGFFNPNLEMIVSLKPDLIISIPNLGNERVMKGLYSLKVPLITVHSHSVADIIDSIEIIGKATGAEVKAKGLISDIQEGIARIRNLTRDVKKRRVLFAFSYEPLIVAGRENIIDELIIASGGLNVAGDTKNRYVRYSMEEAVAEKPEVIIMTTMTRQDDTLDLIRSQNIKAWGKWPQIPAVQAKRIYTVDDDFLVRPGPRVVLGLHKMAEMIHPELFQKKD
jgi:iron complex transport system substrate-binding protein